MFDQLFKSPRAINHHCTRPLLEERLRYLAYRAAQGSTRSSLRLVAQHMLVFVDVLRLETDDEVTIEQIRTAADLWVGSQPYVTDGRHGRLRFISDAKQWLGFLSRLHLPEVPPRPYAHLVDEFADYMIRQRGLSRHTVRIHCWHLGQFFDRFSQQHRSLSDISIRDIDAAIARKCESESYARTYIKHYASALRGFFHYAEQRGWCTRGLAAAIMAPRLYADEGLPKGPPWDNVQRLLRSTEGDEPKNIRDRAIIMLFAVYGMRVGEVRALKLEELNWEKELICVTRPKSRRQQSYPLSYIVGEAILRYLKEVRPHVSYREIFLTLKAPIRPLGSGALYDLVSDRLLAVDASLKHHGPHSYDPSVREWLERWLATEKGAVKPGTIRRYGQVVRDFLAFLGTRADIRLEALTTEDFLKFRDTLLAEGRSPQTANLTIRKVLKRPFTLALNEGIIQRNPVAAVRHLKGKRAEKGVFSPEQIVKLLSVADREWRGMILAGYFTGARLGNIARLKWENIDLGGRSLTFVQEKTDAKIKVPIHPELLEYFQSLKMPIDRGKPIFPSLCHLPGPGRNGLSMRFKRLMKMAGIEDGTARERPGERGHRISLLSYHSLRHGLISALANAGVPPELRKKISGHQDDASHGMYSHHEFETIRKALERVSRLPELPEK